MPNPRTGEAVSGQETIVEQSAANEAWWTEQWLKFPTVSRDDDGRWHYWDVPADSGVYSDDWTVGEGLARDTVARMQAFREGSTVLRRIVRELEPASTVAQGFLTRIEDMLARPDIYLESLEPGAVRRKLSGG